MTPNPKVVLFGVLTEERDHVITVLIRTPVDHKALASALKRLQNSTRRLAQTPATRLFPDSHHSPDNVLGGLEGEGDRLMIHGACASALLRMEELLP